MRILIWQTACHMVEIPGHPSGEEGDGEFLSDSDANPAEQGPEDADDVRWLIESVIRGGRSQLDAVHYMAATCCQAGQYQRAEWFAREGAGIAAEQNIAPMLVEFRIRLGEALLGQGRSDEALEQFHAAYELADRVPLGTTDALFAAMALAIAYRKLGREPQAARWDQVFLALKNAPKEGGTEEKS